MSDSERVPWDAIEAVSGRPAGDCLEYYESHVEELDLEGDAQTVLKRVYDAWKTDLGGERSTPDQGAAYVFAALLERDGHVDGGDLAPTLGPESLSERRPDAETLEALFHDERLTAWQLAVRFGVHYSLVLVWLWEADAPLLRRNLTEETLAAVDEYRAE